MKQIYIAGFPPEGSDDTKILIFDSDTFNTNDAIKLAEGIPNENGIFMRDLPKTYKGNKVMFVMLSKKYVHINEVLQVESLGVFHTIKLRKETNSDLPLTHKWPVEPNAWYKKSQEFMRKQYRHAKYKNYMLTFVSAVATIGACFIGWWIAGIIGLAIGCILAIVVILLTDYSTGLKKGI